MTSLSCQVNWQLGDVGSYPPRLIEIQALRGFSIAAVAMAIDIGKALTVRVDNLEAPAV